MTLEGSNFHQMVPNLKGYGMVSIKTSQGGLWIIFIILYTSSNFFGANDKKTKITRKLCSNPPKGDGQTSSPNQVRTSQISEQSMGMSLRHP